MTEDRGDGTNVDARLEQFESVASQRGGIEGLEDEQWYAVQLLAALGPWLVDDAPAPNVLEEGPRRERVTHATHSRRWRALAGRHLSALETFAIVSAWPDELGKVGRAVKPGDLVVLHACEPARVRVVLDVGRGSDAAKS